jgi:8-oxo-dGTP pyrophosphatase MutT (NUDIX family)
MLPKCFYRVSTKALITKDDKVLLIMEADGRWELPGGGMEVDESFESGLKREVKEEIGVNPVTISKQPVYAWTLVNEDKSTHLIKPTLILIFDVTVDSYDFVGNPNESAKIEFFSKDELSKLELHPNIKRLPDFL